MYCSTCGALIPAGRYECGTCGSTAALPATAGRTEVVDLGAAMPNLTGIVVCPRCDYRGGGIPYFNRGSHMAGLVAATVVTLPGALGAGGAIYYWLRRDHRICPRCGTSWGKRTEIMLPSERPTAAQVGPVRPGRGAEVPMRVWSVMLGVLGAIMLVAGVAEMELVLLGFGMLFGVGAFALHRGANAARESRRAALMASLQLSVVKLAGERKGRLTVTEVAASLSWPMRRAEKVLDSLEDGWRVNSTVTDEGVIVYEFREILLG